MAENSETAGETGETSEEKKKPVTTRVNALRAAEIQGRAEERGVSQADVMREALETYLEEEATVEEVEPAARPEGPLPSDAVSEEEEVVTQEGDVIETETVEGETSDAEEIETEEIENVDEDDEEPVEEESDESGGESDEEAAGGATAAVVIGALLIVLRLLQGDTGEVPPNTQP